MLSKYLDLEPVYELYIVFYKLLHRLHKLRKNKNNNILTPYQYNSLFNPYKYLYPYSIDLKYHTKSYDVKKQLKIIKSYKKMDTNYKIPYNKYMSKHAFIINELNTKFKLFTNCKNVLEITSEEILTDSLYYIKNDSKYTVLSYNGKPTDDNVTLFNTLVFNSTFIKSVDELEEEYDFILMGELLPHNYQKIGIAWEENKTRILLYNLYYALKHLKRSSNLVINIYEIKTDFTLSMIFLLDKCFEDVNLYSSDQMLHNIRRATYNYIICKNLKRKSGLKILYNLIKKYNINPDTFETYHKCDLKEYYKKVYPSCFDHKMCILDKSYIDHVINPDDTFLTGKQNYPDQIIKMKGARLEKIVKMVNKYNKNRSECKIKFINFINDHIYADQKYINKFNKNAEYISYRYCQKYKIETVKEILKPNSIIYG